MRVETIETERLYLRGFQKEDAIFAISIWNDPEMGNICQIRQWKKSTKST